MTNSAAAASWGDEWLGSSWLRWFFVALPRMAWVTLLVLTLLWVVQVEGSLGFNLDSTFGWHAFFMVLATICVGESILAVSASSSSSGASGWPSGNKVVVGRWRLGVIKHVALHAATVVLSILALVAIGYYKKLNVAAAGASFPFWTLFSPHSWLGIVLVIMWVVQVAVRAVHSRVLSAAAKVVSHRTHVFLGKAVFVTALATCALGFQDMQGSDLSVDVDDMAYQPLSVWANYACAAVVMLLVFGLAVLGISDMARGVEPIYSGKALSSPFHSHIVTSPSPSRLEFSAVTSSAAEV